MSAPRTMSELHEWDLRNAVAGGPRLSATLGTQQQREFLRDVFTELDAERAAFADLEQEYAQAVRALREAKPCVCGWKFIKASDQRRFDRASDTLNNVLSTPRAQSVKEVE